MCLIYMNKILLTFTLLSLFTLVSCDNDNIVAAEDEFRVIIEDEKDIACSLPVITFLDKKDRVKEKTNSETLTYIAFQFDTNLNTKGAELIIKFTPTAANDLKLCNTLGTSYPSITVLEARLAD